MNPEESKNEADLPRAGHNYLKLNNNNKAAWLRIISLGIFRKNILVRTNLIDLNLFNKGIKKFYTSDKAR